MVFCSIHGLLAAARLASYSLKTLPVFFIESVGMHILVSYLILFRCNNYKINNMMIN